MKKIRAYLHECMALYCRMVCSERNGHYSTGMYYRV